MGCLTPWQRWHNWRWLKPGNGDLMMMTHALRSLMNLLPMSLLLCYACPVQSEYSRSYMDAQPMASVSTDGIKIAYRVLGPEETQPHVNRSPQSRPLSHSEVRAGTSEACSRGMRRRFPRVAAVR